MHDSGILKVLVLVGISLTILVGFKEKFSEKNQTGTPKIKNTVTPKTDESDPGEDIGEESLILDLGPVTEDRKKFDVWYDTLEKDISEKKDVKERLEILNKGLAKLEKNREQLLNLKFNEEIEIDFLIKPLKMLPQVSQFKAQNCPDYQMKILSHFDPTSESETKDPSLKKAINVFKLICTN